MTYILYCLELCDRTKQSLQSGSKVFEMQLPSAVSVWAPNISSAEAAPYFISK